MTKSNTPIDCDVCENSNDLMIDILDKAKVICDPKSKFVNESLDGSLLIAGFIRRIKLIECIDNIMPSRNGNAILSYGEHIAILVIHYSNSQANGLSNIQEHAKALNFAYLLDRPNINSDLFDDNYRFTVSEVLDHIHAFGCSHLFSRVIEYMYINLGLKKKQSPKIVTIDTTNHHYTGIDRSALGVTYSQDLDNFPFEDQSYPPKLNRGHSKCNRHEDPQITSLAAVDAETGIALLHKNLDGSYSDKKSFPQAFEYLINTTKEIFTSIEYIVSDCAGCTEAGFDAFKNTDINYVTRIPNSYALAQELISDFLENKRPVNDYDSFLSPSKTSKEKEPLQGKIYKGYKLYDKDIVACVYLNPNRLNIDSRIARLEKALRKVEVKAHKIKAKCKADAKIKYQKLVKDYPLYKFDVTNICETYKNSRRGKPTGDTTKVLTDVKYEISVSVNKEAVVEDAIRSSCFVICTTDTKNSIDAKELLKLYRCNTAVEMHWKRIKNGVSQVESIFLRKPERIEALNTICALTGALMAACEYYIRQVFKKHNMFIIDALGNIEYQPTFEATKRFINSFQLTFDADTEVFKNNYKFTKSKKALKKVPEKLQKNPDLFLQILFAVLGDSWDYLNEKGINRLKLNKRVNVASNSQKSKNINPH